MRICNLQHQLERHFNRGASGHRESGQLALRNLLYSLLGGYSPNTNMNLAQDTVEFLRNRWWMVAIASSAVGVAAVSARLSESGAAREKRIEESRRKELRAIASRISHYAKSVRQRFPDGAVVVSEQDLAAQLRKRPDYILKALNALLNEQKVERMPLTGYWRLHS